MSDNEANDPEDMDLSAMSLEFPELIHASTGTARRMNITSAAGRPKAPTDTGAGPSTRTRKRAPAARTAKDKKDKTSEGKDCPARKKQRQDSDDSDDDGSYGEYSELITIAREQLKATQEHIRTTNELHQMIDARFAYLTDMVKEVRDSQRACERSMQSMQEVTTTTHLRIESLQKPRSATNVSPTPALTWQESLPAQTRAFGVA